MHINNLHNGQLFVSHGFGKRLAAEMVIRRFHAFGSITARHEEGRLMVSRQVERGSYFCGLEPLHPTSSQTQFGCLKHHMRTHDRAIHVSRTLAVFGPRQISVIANEEHYRRMVRTAGQLIDFRDCLGTLQHIDMLWLHVLRCRSESTCLKDRVDFLLLNGRLCILTYRKTLTR